MRAVNQTEGAKSEGNLRVLKLHRETLRVLDAGDLAPPRATRQTEFCIPTEKCTRGGCGHLMRQR